jgi:nicotinamidase-related amidase
MGWRGCDVKPAGVRQPEQCALLKRFRRPAQMNWNGFCCAIGAGRLLRAMGPEGNRMASDFEDHCWKDIVPPDVLGIYTHYERKTFVGPAPALIAIDLYELSYQGGARPVAEVAKTYPSSCGENAFAAIEPTRRLFAAARAAGLPVFYSTMDTRGDSLPSSVTATRRRNIQVDPALYAIRSDFKPQPGDVVITKQRASAFFGTPLVAHLTQLGVRSVVICGESTSGCVRASAVDAYSHGYHVTLVEECCFDRSLLSHKINLFDLHHKYADVMKVDDVVAHLGMLAVRKAS